MLNGSGLLLISSTGRQGWCEELRRERQKRAREIRGDKEKQKEVKMTVVQR